MSLMLIQRVNHVAANIAGTAGDQDRHAVRLLKRTDWWKRNASDGVTPRLFDERAAC